MYTSHARIALALLVSVGSVPQSRADVVLEWNEEILEIVRLERTPPPVASRALAITHAAVFDAVNGIRRTHESCFAANGALSAKLVPMTASVEAAASAAARRAMGSLYPRHAARFEALHASLLSGIPGGTHRALGLTWGDRCARTILDARANDGATDSVGTPAWDGPGDWEPTPPAFAPYLLPQWAFLVPFTMTSPSQFRPPGPPPLASSEWVVDYRLTQALGGLDSPVRTADQTEIALFWADGGGTETPPGHWNHIAADVSRSRGLTLEQNARMFALLNLALADAGICAWDAKYTYHCWRPVTAIRAGGSDGNDATDEDPTWTPLLVTPPFPEHTSGHSTFSAAAATVLAWYFGSDAVPFATGSDFLPGVTRRFSRFSEAAEEAGTSRIYGGIHFMSANLDGLDSGAKIGRWVVTRLLLPRRPSGRPSGGG